MGNSILLDGKYTRGFYSARAVVSYPFLRNGDRTAIVVQRQFRVRESSYMPGQIGVERDPRYPMAYLVAESDPVPTGIGDVIQVVRTFASVPADQVTYASRAISAPDVSQYGIANNRNFYGTGTAFALYGYGGKLWFGPTIYGPSAAATSVDNGADTDITCTAHGITAADGLVVIWSITSVVFADALTVIDANTVRVLGVNMGTAVTAIYRKFRTYNAGTYSIRIKDTQRFYLPGITSGISTPLDIPIPVGAVNDTTILTAVSAATSGLITYDASELTRWDDGPIYTVSETQIDIGDL